jgi:hypothetical protein
VRQQSRPVALPIQVTVWVDQKGYEVQSRDDGHGTRVRSLISSSKRCEDLCAREPCQNGLCHKTLCKKKIYRFGQRSPLWREASKMINDLDGLAKFMTRYGPLDPTGQYGRTGPLQKHNITEDDAAVLVKTIRELSSAADMTDADGRASAKAMLAETSGRFRNAELTLQADGSVSVEVPSLLAFLKWEMLSQIGRGQTIRTCPICSRPVAVGGRRKVTRRVDAKYCSRSCKTRASQLKKRAELA